MNGVNKGDPYNEYTWKARLRSPTDYPSEDPVKYVSVAATDIALQFSRPFISRLWPEFLLRTGLTA